MPKPITFNYKKLVLVLLLAFYSSNIYAAKIEFVGFKVIGESENYHVNTRVLFEPTEYLKKAVLNGVTLNARVQFRFGQQRNWWFNKETSLITILYQLKYHALSQHFLLSRNDTNEHWNFSTLSSALRKLGELKQYKLPEIKKSKNSKNNYLVAVADMGPENLRIPLRVQSLFSDKFVIKSEGVMWPLP